MANAIEVTKDFPASRERTVLLELLNVMKTLKQAQIDAVPFEVRQRLRHRFAKSILGRSVEIELAPPLCRYPSTENPLAFLRNTGR